MKYCDGWYVGISIAIFYPMNYYLHMHANTINKMKQELDDSVAIKRCAKRHNVVGDLSVMKVCYMLRHHPDLSVSEVASLIGLSVSATSRCLTKLKSADVVESTKQAQSVRYRLLDNPFTNNLVGQLDIA